LLNFYRGYNLSNKLDNLFEGNVIKIGVFNYSNEILYDIGTIEYDKIYKSFNWLFSSLLKNKAVVIKRGEGRDGGNIIIVYNNNESYRIFITYAKSSQIIGITIFNKYNFSITKYYMIENDAADNFLSIYKDFLSIE
jgi:hypothetical protein